MEHQFQFKKTFKGGTFPKLSYTFLNIILKFSFPATVFYLYRNDNTNEKVKYCHLFVFNKIKSFYVSIRLRGVWNKMLTLFKKTKLDTKNSLNLIIKLNIYIKNIVHWKIRIRICITLIDTSVVFGKIHHQKIHLKLKSMLVYNTKQNNNCIIQRRWIRSKTRITFFDSTLFNCVLVSWQDWANWRRWKKSKMRLTNLCVIIFGSMYVTISFRGSSNNKTTISTPKVQKSSFCEVTTPLTV